jgi:hypothetical protein
MSKDLAPFFRSTGKSLIPADKDAEELMASLGPSSIVRVKITKPRRLKFHRWFFACIQGYFENWPTDCDDFQPDNAEHLRAWATCKAGYRDILGERLDHNEGDALTMMEFVTKCLTRQRERGYGFVVVHNRSLVFMTPRSIAFDTLDQAAFAPIANQILNVLEAASGISVASMMAENAA